MPIQFLTPIIQPAFNRNAGCGSDMMTDKVRIDTLRADLLDANNETFLARQAEFESNVRSYPRKLPLAITKAEGVWLTDADNKQYLDCLAGAGTLALGHNHPDVLQSIQSVITSGLPLHTRSDYPVKRSFLRIPALCCRAKGKNTACSSPVRPALTPWKRR
jgi:diaminobutyrate-2-oxoglutarate transaminase